ncbi:MAG: DUF58 domain-containing protein [Steroidobacter sp.]|nr:DUF58 domain-containing protein [Steroidobacter sp.]
MIRTLPPAFALGVKKTVHLALSLEGERTWNCQLYDHVDATLLTEGIPADVTLSGGQRADLSYQVTPTRRGVVHFAPADVRIRSLWNWWELMERLGDDQHCRVYPDFAQVSRYAWLAGDRRLSEIGIKTFQQRGEGTDFKQLSEYRSGDPVRHIDWRATLRFEKLIVREFQSERDQCVLLLMDCGRRMRADDRVGAIGSSHFDQVLNAVMLLSYVALKQGDAVGALTFGTPPGEQHWFPPRKGAATLNALMGELYAVQPSPTHSDYLSAARDLLSRYNRRALVVLITNFRDEDSSEFSQAITLLRSRHLVLTASLRERVVRELASQPIQHGAVDHDPPLEIASAHLYEQSRRDALNRMTAHHSLVVDAEPERLGIELTNPYQSLKRAGANERARSITASRLRQGSNDAEAQRIVLALRIVARPTQRRAYRRGLVVPAAATIESTHAVASLPGTTVSRRTLVGLVETVLHPFPHVPRRVVQAELVGLEAAHRRGLGDAIGAGMQGPIGMLGLQRLIADVAELASFSGRVAPEPRRRRATARRVFPLGFAGQSIGLAGFLGQPARIADGHLEVHVDHRAPATAPVVIAHCLTGLVGHASVPLVEGHFVLANGEWLGEGHRVLRRLVVVVVRLSAGRTHQELARRHDHQFGAVRAILVVLAFEGGRGVGHACRQQQQTPQSQLPLDSHCFCTVTDQGVEPTRSVAADGR